MIREVIAAHAHGGYKERSQPTAAVPRPVRHLLTAILLLVAVIHLLPLAGVAGVGRLQQLYGVAVGDPNLEILLRHRAVLFGLLGALLALAAFQPSLQVAGVVAGSLSLASFVALAWSVGGFNPALGRVVMVDLAALGLLIMAGGLLLAQGYAAPPMHH